MPRFRDGGRGSRDGGLDGRIDGGSAQQYLKWVPIVIGTPLNSRPSCISEDLGGLPLALSFRAAVGIAARPFGSYQLLPAGVCSRALPAGTLLLVYWVRLSTSVSSTNSRFFIQPSQLTFCLRNLLRDRLYRKHPVYRR